MKQLTYFAKPKRWEVSVGGLYYATFSQHSDFRWDGINLDKYSKSYANPQLFLSNQPHLFVEFKKIESFIQIFHEYFFCGITNIKNVKRNQKNEYFFEFELNDFKYIFTCSTRLDKYITIRNTEFIVDYIDVSEFFSDEQWAKIVDYIKTKSPLRINFLFEK